MNKKYKFEVWSFGYKVEEFETDDLEEIRRIAMNYLDKDIGVKLFIDNKEIPFLNIKRTLGINLFTKM